ncbi:Na+/H+ antiporter NhaC family protein [Oceanimonas sp. NS1]|nr:Na+/H+ antiporter NhaC family protein [Oceanimonas sp. NS1]
MDTHPFIQSIWSLFPPVLAIVLAIVTRRVLLSLGLGIVLAALLLLQFQPVAAFTHLAGKVFNLFWDEGAVNEWNVNILLFLLLLGCIISMLSRAGATHAFAEWAQARIKSRRQAKVMTGLLVFVFFIDDYFHSLSVGTICRPVTDRFGISRAKLAYLLDSTAAPICVLMPISSWGAYIIALIGGILASYGLTGQSPWRLFDHGSHEFLRHLYPADGDSGDQGGGIWGRCVATSAERWTASFMMPTRAPPGVHDHERSGGRVSDLLFAIGGLTLVTLAGLIWTGAQALSEAGQAFSLLGALENTNVGRSLVSGGIAGVLICALALVRERTSARDWLHTLAVGIKGMLPAIYILLFAWTIAGLISELETGKYLASLVQQNLPLYLLPAILFVLAGIMAFATGTSWGTFGVMLPHRRRHDHGH